MSGIVMKFDRRVNRLRAKHFAMSRGYYFKLMKNGIIEVRPNRRARLPIATFATVLLLGLLFKAVAFANYGPDKYASKLDMLKAGTAIERASAWVLEPRTPTYAISSFLAPVLR